MSQPRWLARSVFSLLAAFSTVQAAEDVIINEFNAESEATEWARWWGGAAQRFSFDSAMDSDGNANSGSLRVEVDFDNTLGDNQFSFLKNFNTVDGSQYSNLVMDIYWDINSPTRSPGDYGYLEPGLKRSDWSQLWLTPGAVTTAGEWFQLSLPIDQTAQGVEAIAGVILKMWAGNSLNGTTRFWIDNVKLIARTVTSNPPPTMAIAKATQGLRMVANVAGAQYQRQSIRTVSPEFSWVGNFDPVTYSVTIKEYPGSNYSGFQTHVFIVPGSTIPATQTSPDWDQPNIVFFHIGNNAQGGASGTFRYKVNQPSGNSMIWGTGTLASVSAPSPIGTWNLTFNPEGGGITITSPEGTSTNFFMPAEHESLFAGPAYAYFGVQPNEMRNIGQGATLSQVQITGVPNPIDDTFTTAALDSAKWEYAAESAAGITSIPPNAIGWVSWTLPDRDFVLEAATDLVAQDWGPVTLPVAQAGAEKRTLITSDNTTSVTGSSGNHFFRLRKTQ